MLWATAMPLIRVPKRRAAAALANIDDLQPSAPCELDCQGAILVALRGRLRDRRREVPAEVWPELERWLADAPGLLTDMLPRRVLANGEAAAVIEALMAWHVAALVSEGVCPMAVLMAEGLLNALLAGPQTISGHELVDFAEDVLARMGAQQQG